MTCDCISPNLYVGPDLDDDKDFAKLKSLRITAVLSLQTGEDLRQGGIERERKAATKASLTFRNVPVEDFDPTDLQRRLPDCVTALDRLLKAGHTVYLHCTAGVTRSPTVAVAYLHWCQGWQLERALAHVRTARDCSPNGEAIRRAHWPI
jgi:protein-tyrosine phosphatase